jgi:hypothetical protein
MADAVSGGYRYLLNGEAAAVTETWRRWQLPSGEERVSSVRRAPGVEIQVEAGVENGLVQACEIQWHADAISIQAEYSLREGELQFLRQQEGNPVERETSVPGDGGLLLLFPLMRIFTGPLIARLLDGGGRGTVIVPEIGQADDSDGLLKPRVSQREARVLEAHTELMVDGLAVSCCLCEYTGDQYGAGSRFWLGEDETLLRYQWQQAPDQCWDVWLQHLTYSQAQ